jgi:hypothetical protein
MKSSEAFILLACVVHLLVGEFEKHVSVARKRRPEFICGRAPTGQVLAVKRLYAHSIKAAFPVQMNDTLPRLLPSAKRRAIIATRGHNQREPFFVDDGVRVSPLTSPSDIDGVLWHFPALGAPALNAYRHLLDLNSGNSSKVTLKRVSPLPQRSLSQTLGNQLVNAGNFRRVCPFLLYQSATLF